MHEKQRESLEVKIVAKNLPSRRLESLCGLSLETDYYHYCLKSTPFIPPGACEKQPECFDSEVERAQEDVTMSRRAS